jgi:tetratricopeptide (TPR) repeat protein
MKAVTHFQQAIESDPTYAQGYAGLADCYNILGYYNSLSPRDAYPKGRAAAAKALQLDGTLAEPHATLGVVKRDFEWDWAGAEEDFQRAIEMNPSYVEVYHWRSTLLSLLERHDEALLQKRKALAMDPLSVVITTDLARMFYFHREYDRAIDQYRAALELDRASASRTYGSRRHSNRKAGSTRRSPNCKQVSVCRGRARMHCPGWRMDTRSPETARTLAPY